MIMKNSFVRGLVVLAAGVLVPVALSAAGIPAPRIPVGFSLAATGGEPAPIPFTLATPAGEPGGLAGPGGLGVIEDSGAPYRTALGYNALAANISGSRNTAFGYNALQFENRGSDLTAIGANSIGRTNWAGNGTTAIGADALGNAGFIGNGNTVVGRLALGVVAISEDYNTAIGYGSLSNSRGPRNTAVGAIAGPSDEWGMDNTAMGYRALVSSGRLFGLPSDGNTAIGCLALENLSGVASYTQEGPTRFNTALGYSAGLLRNYW